MRKDQYTASAAASSNQLNFIEKKQSWTDIFVQWFHNFLETAE